MKKIISFAAAWWYECAGALSGVCILKRAVGADPAVALFLFIFVALAYGGLYRRINGRLAERRQAEQSSSQRDEFIEQVERRIALARKEGDEP